MKLFELRTELELPVPLEDNFRFFADAHNLERITPPRPRFEVLTPRPIPMRVGALIDYRLRVRGAPLRWRTEITAWEPPFRFVDEQIRGPYRVWIHEHRFEERDGLTIARDHVRYRPIGGRLVQKLWVERDVRAIFDYRRRRLTELLGGGRAVDFEAAIQRPA